MNPLVWYPHPQLELANMYQSGEISTMWQVAKQTDLQFNMVRRVLKEISAKDQLECCKCTGSWLTVCCTLVTPSGCGSLYLACRDVS